MATEDLAGGTEQNTAGETAETVLTTEVQDAGQGGVGEEALKGGGSDGNKPEGEGGEKAGDGSDGKKPEDAKPAEIPEAYELKVPEGMTLDEKLVQDLTPVLKGKSFTNEEAQQLVDMHIGALQAQAKAQQDAWANTLNTWRDEITSDPEFGGEKFNATVRAAQTVIARYDTDGRLKADLKNFGIGNLPSLIRVLARAGKDMAEDNIIGAGGAGSVLPPEVRMYPTMNKK